MPDKKLLVSPIGRLSFPFLFEQDENNKYRATLIFKGTDDLAAIENLVQEAADKQWGKGKMPKKTKLPIHDNDTVEDREGKRWGGYEEDSARHIRCWSTRKPKVVGREKDPETGKLVELNKDEVYAGCYVKASLSAFAGVHKEGGPYVSLILSNIQKWDDGEALAGVITEPDDDFAEDVANAVS